MRKQYKEGDNYNEWWECKRKIPYTKWCAENKIRTIKGRGTDPRSHILKAYKCKYCQFYHVGHEGIESKRLGLITDNGL